MPVCSCLFSPLCGQFVSLRRLLSAAAEVLRSVDEVIQRFDGRLAALLVEFSHGAGGQLHDTCQLVQQLLERLDLLDGVRLAGVMSVT